MRLAVLCHVSVSFNALDLSMEGRAERPRSAAAACTNGSRPTRAAKHSQVSIGLIQAKTLPSMAPPLEGAAVSDAQARYQELSLIHI